MGMILILLVPTIVLALLSFILFGSLRSMEMQVGFGGVLSRWENPLLFWLMVALQISGILVLLAIIYWEIFILPDMVMS
jgi:hypothetical protein